MLFKFNNYVIEINIRLFIDFVKIKNSPFQGCN